MFIHLLVAKGVSKTPNKTASEDIISLAHSYLKNYDKSDAGKYFFKFSLAPDSSSELIVG